MAKKKRNKTREQRYRDHTKFVLIGGLVMSLTMLVSSIQPFFGFGVFISGATAGVMFAFYLSDKLLQSDQKEKCAPISAAFADIPEIVAIYFRQDELVVYVQKDAIEVFEKVVVAEDMLREKGYKYDLSIRSVSSKEELSDPSGSTVVFRNEAFFLTRKEECD